MTRCSRQVEGMQCGLPDSHPWPHRYIIANSFRDRLRHEYFLFRFQFTTFPDFVNAVVFKKARR